MGLIYVDAHADFATPESSRTGSAASMCLPLAVGRGDTPLARLNGDAPLARGEVVVVIGRRDDWDEPWYGEDVLRASPVLDLAQATIRDRGPAAAATASLERLTPNVHGFWNHVDADVLDPTVLPAVDSPEPGGLSLEELTELLTPLARPPSALRRAEGDVTHFLLTSLWDSVDSIKRFAGEDYARARYYDEDDAFLLEREPCVTHDEVVVALLTERVNP